MDWINTYKCKLLSQHENKNSFTRDALANERSFLAYVRCSTTFLISAFTIIQLFLQVLIKSERAFLDGTATEGNTEKLDAYHLRLFEYNHIIQPLCIFMGSLAIFTVCLGLKKSWLNSYNIAEKAKFQPGIIGAAIIILSLFAVDIIILRECILLGKIEYNNSG